MDTRTARQSQPQQSLTPVHHRQSACWVYSCPTSRGCTRGYVHSLLCHSQIAENALIEQLKGKTMIDWAGFVPAALLVSLIPGANQLLGLSNAVRHGTGYALAGVGGRLAAFVVLIAVVVAGLGAVLAASATALTVIKWIGVVYLAWIGISALRRGWRTPAVPAGMAPTEAKALFPIMGSEFVVAISNPKALLLFAALLPQFVAGSEGGTGAQIAVLGTAYLGVELVVGLGYIWIGSRIAATGLTATTQRKVDLGSGVCFIGLAGLLAAEELA
jgi:threonine/homoserine/homoserine lactone efflux protein